MNTAHQLVVDVPRAPATRFLKPSSSVPGLTSSNSVAALAIVDAIHFCGALDRGCRRFLVTFNQTVAYAAVRARPKQR